MASVPLMLIHGYIHRARGRCRVCSEFSATGDTGWEWRVLPAAVFWVRVVGASFDVPGENFGASDVDVSSVRANVQDVVAVAPLPESDCEAGRK